MDTQYGIDWGDENHENQIITESRSDDLIEENNEMEDEEYLVGEEIIPSSEIITISNSLDQIAAENLIYMAQDGTVAVMGDLIEEQVDQVDNADYNEQQYFECHVTEEVITDDWVQQQGEDRVEVPVDQLTGADQNEEVLVPLPTDEYTTLRPYPCDFCSRRFRKKANLTTHMVAHKNVKPHACNLCGARYLRKMELMEHLKHHAQIPHSDLDYMHPSERDDDGNNIHDDDNDPLLTVMHPPDLGNKQQRRKAPSKIHSNIVQARKVVVKEKMDITKKKRFEYDASDHYYDGTDHSMIDDDMTCDGSRPFICNVCGVSFTREKALNSHIALHGIDNVLECETCNEVFWSIESLQEHQKMHDEDDDDNDDDDEEEDDEAENSGSEYDPNAESDEDFGTDYGSYYCKICGMAYHRLDLLKRHARTHKDDNNKISKKDKIDTHCCNICGIIFKDALDLLAHGEVHTRANLQKCTLCGETFSHEKDIKNHIATLHADAITETTCRLCGKHCKDERTLLKHAWDHSKEKNHSCNKCGKTFHNKARLNRHMQSHRNKSVACNVCGETFPDGRSLMNHRHSHTNLSGRQFPCRECGKTFGSRSSQQIHMRIHTGERPYGCRYCWKAFADGGTLRKHERIHTGEKPYACPVCPRAFNQRVVLREHIRSHHSAPDTNYEGSSTPFYCTVCGNLFRSSSEIIQHLIEHSDANTESNRQPVLGPRKYKRRRKLKPEELEVMRKINKNDTPTKARPTRKTAKTSRKSDADLGYKLDEIQEELTYETSDARNDEDIIDTSADETHHLNEHTIVSRTKIESINETSTSVFSSIDEESDDFTATTTKRKSPNKKSSNISTVIASPVASQRSARVIHTSKKRVVVETKGGKMTTKLQTIVTPTPKIEKIQSIAVTSTRKSSRKTKPSIAQEQPIAIPIQTKTLTNGTARTKKSSQLVLGTSYSNNSRIQNNVDAEQSVKSTNFSSDVVSDLEEILGSPIKKTDFVTDKRNKQTVNDDIKTAIEYIDDSIKPSTRSSKRLSARGKYMPIETISKASPSRMRNNRHGGKKNAIFMEEQSDAECNNQDTLIHRKSDNTSPNVILNIKQEREVSYTMTDDTNIFTCEMCSAVFSDRAQLLVHVPVHI